MARRTVQRPEVAPRYCFEVTFSGADFLGHIAKLDAELQKTKELRPYLVADRTREEFLMLTGEEFKKTHAGFKIALRS